MEVGFGGLLYCEELVSNLRKWCGVDKVWKNCDFWYWITGYSHINIFFKEFDLEKNSVELRWSHQTRSAMKHKTIFHHVLNICIFLTFLPPVLQADPSDCFLRDLVRLLVVKISKYWWNYQNYNDPLPQIDLLKSSVK